MPISKHAREKNLLHWDQRAADITRKNTYSTCARIVSAVFSSVHTWVMTGNILPNESWSQVQGLQRHHVTSSLLKAWLHGDRKKHAFYLEKPWPMSKNVTNLVVTVLEWGHPNGYYVIPFNLTAIGRHNVRSRHSFNALTFSRSNVNKNSCCLHQQRVWSYCCMFDIESTLSTYIPDCDQKFVANIPSTILHTKRPNLFVLHPIPVPNRQAEDLIRRCPLCWMDLRQSLQSWTMRQRWI